MNLARVVSDSKPHAVGRSVVAAAVVLVILAGVFYLTANPRPFTSASTNLYTFTNGNSGTISLSTFSTAVTAYPNAVQVTVPYGGGENDDGATQYLPQAISVVIGVNNTVTWTNQDLITHNVISTSGAFYSGDLSSGQSYTFTFTQAGTYPYYCGYYPIMRGVVLVKDP